MFPSSSGATMVYAIVAIVIGMLFLSLAFTIAVVALGGLVYACWKFYKYINALANDPIKRQVENYRLARALRHWYLYLPITIFVGIPVGVIMTVILSLQGYIGALMFLLAVPGCGIFIDFAFAGMWGLGWVADFRKYNRQQAILRIGKRIESKSKQDRGATDYNRVHITPVEVGRDLALNLTFDEGVDKTVQGKIFRELRRLSDPFGCPLYPKDSDVWQYVN